MRTHVDAYRPPQIGSTTLLALAAGLLSQLALAAAPGTVDLLATPPEITASVAPNVALTFDDSGSMSWQYMPDDRPYESPAKDWVQSDPFPRQDSDDWFCAGRIDARVTDPTNPRSKPMNGMYYDPNVTYRPPLKADGVTEFPLPTFTAAWNDGIAHNRPLAPAASGTRNLGTSKYCARTHYQLASGNFSQDWSNSGLITSNNNWNSVPYLTGYRGDDNVTAAGVNPATVLQVGNRTVNVAKDITTPSTYSSTDTNYGVFEVTGGTEIGSNFTIALQPSSNTGSTNAYAPNLVLRLDTTSCTNVTLSYRLRDIDTGTSATQPVAIQVRDKTSDFNANFTLIRAVTNANTGGATTFNDTLATAFNDKRAIEIRWITTNSTNGNDAMIGIDDIVVSGTCGTPVVDPPAGAGYFQLKSSVVLIQDTFGRITNPAAALYNPKNWEWVALPAAQQQNFANWYSYYRSRTNSAKTAMSRAFAPFDANIRVAWQNLGFNAKCAVPSYPGCNAVVDAPVFGPTPGTPGNPTATPPIPDIPATPATPIYAFANPSTARTNFYNWLFQIPASGGTPNIAASIRVGEYFKRAGGAVDTNPYWDRNYLIPSESRELSCRQNFHINMSDGFWNSVGGTGHPTGTLHEPTGTHLYSRTAIAALPDGRPYDPATAESKVITNYTGTAVQPILNDIMFHYWATDLRPDFALASATRLKVPPFIPDRSTNLFGIPVAAGQDPRSNREIYWNPANDPATWPHLVNFNISFGLDGTLPQTTSVYTDLRLGTSTTWKWPFPVIGTDDGRKLDDFWHAALSSRGRFLSAKNPEELITSLQEVIASIVARRGASTAVSVSLPIITDGTTGYTAGYDSTDWAGFFLRNTLDPTTAERLTALWDAGCILTGGACATTGQSALPVRDPNTRVILTSSGTPGSGTPFQWTSLTTAQKARLNIDPTTINLVTNTGTADVYGQQRVEYVRGSRVHETTPLPHFRQRSSVLGAVIRGQPIYVSSPTAGYPDTFPSGSPEDVARIAGNSYAAFQVTHRERSPTVYVAANDGMLHAFNGANGVERWAYVPNTVIENFRLTRSTQFEGGFTPTVDDKPQVTDVFINGAWRTVLLGSMRLGGRGIYLLDITQVPATGATETALASSIPKWEFSNVRPPGDTSSDCAVGGRFCSSLGYTYEGVNIARIKYQNKWVALVSSGYFPIDGSDPASSSLKANQTSLLVIDLETGQLLREILTSTSPDAATQSFGLSQAIVMDTGTDFIDDVAIAGDLAGNLWRFDLSGNAPADWKVDLMFTTYGAGGGATAGASGAVGERPIASAPIVMRDSTGREPIIVFGSGKFIGLTDRTASIPQQSFYGVEDYGTCSATNTDACNFYPIRPNELTVQKITQSVAGIRRIDPSTETAPTTSRGWRIRLDVTGEGGERSLDTPFPFYSSNQVLLRSIIPKGVDPCDPGARYGLMVVNAADGGPDVDPADTSASRTVGGVVSSSTPPGDPITLRGGGNVVIAGLTERDGVGAVINQAVVDAINASLSNADDIWHRGAWRDLQQ